MNQAFHEKRRSRTDRREDERTRQSLERMKQSTREATAFLLGCAFTLAAVGLFW